MKVLQISRWAYEAGDILLDYQKDLNLLKIKVKKDQSVASLADVESEKCIINHIKKLYPTHKILAEEMFFEALPKMKNYEELKKEPFLWIIDPLDGTNNYLNGLNYYAVCISLCCYGEVQLGLVYRPGTGEVFWAKKGEGAYYFQKGQEKNLKKIKMLVSSDEKKHLRESFLVTGIGAQPEGKNFYKSQYWQTFEKITFSSRSIRILGSAALDLCYVAYGLYDGFWQKGLYPWDMAGPGIICKEAGVRVTNFKGEKFSPFQKDILAASKTLHQKLKKLIN